jgi:DNA ligase D-like protein (predicted polymerase)
MSTPTIVEVEGRKLKLTNLEKILYPATGFTKGQVVDFYVRIAPVLVPHLAGRALTMKRYPEGVDHEYFFEKNAPMHRPDWVKTAPVWSDSNRRTINFILANDLPTLVWIANLASIELHPSLPLAPDIATPTMIVFDLDPGPPANIVQCAQVGLWVREIFDHFGCGVFRKLPGRKGCRSIFRCTQKPATSRRSLCPRGGAFAGAGTSRPGGLRHEERRCARIRYSSTGARTTSTKPRSRCIPCERVNIQPSRRPLPGKKSSRR